MKELLGELEIVDFGFDVEAFQAQEIYEIIQEAQSTIASENGEADYRLTAVSRGKASRRSKRAVEMRSGPDGARSEPLFVYVCWHRDSLPDPRLFFFFKCSSFKEREERDPLLDVGQFRS